MRIFSRVMSFDHAAFSTRVLQEELGTRCFPGDSCNRPVRPCRAACDMAGEVVPMAVMKRCQFYNSIFGAVSAVLHNVSVPSRRGR
jgi:hypothetical protein